MRSRALTAGIAGLAVAVAAALSAPGTPANAITSGPGIEPAASYAQGEVTPLDRSPYQLRFTRTPEATRAAIADLARRHVLTRTTLHQALDTPDGTLLNSARPECAEASAAVSQLAAQTSVQAYCWSSDRQTSAWYPQAFTSSSDASDDSTYDHDHLIAVSWYNATPVPGQVRVSFARAPERAGTDLDFSDVLLAIPSGDQANPAFTDLDLHAGGIGWYGHYLYVIDTDNGIRLFDLRQVFQVSTGRDELGVDPGDGKFYAHGYRYVLFQAGRYDRILQGDGDARTCDRTPSDIRQHYCFSASGVDRTTRPASLLTGEYRVHADMQTDFENGQPDRLLRWPLDPSSGLLRADGNGVVRASGAFGTWTERIQGVTSYAGTFFASTSNGDSPGVLWTDRLDTPARNNLWAVGAEAVGVWRPGGRAWGLTEHPGARVVFQVPLADTLP